MDLIKIKTNENNVYYINVNNINQFRYRSEDDLTVIDTADNTFIFEGDQTKELAKSLTMIDAGHLTVMGEEWTERSL